MAQKRFTRACETLARARKLSRNTPALQFNIATKGGQQVKINCFRNAIEAATDQNRKDIEEKIVSVTCRITNQVYSNIHASPVFLEARRWSLYLESLGTIIKTLESVHTLVPKNTVIVRSIISLCEKNMGKFEYMNYNTGKKYYNKREAN